VALDLATLRTQVRELNWNLPASGSKPIVILLHGLGGDRDDWMNPFQDRNWPYDHRCDPEEIDEGVHSGPAMGKWPGLDTRYFLSPRLQSNSRGADRSDDRSWWQALVSAGFPVFTYSQAPTLLMPLSQGVVAEFKRFMETIMRDVLGDPALCDRKIVLLGHSRGGLIARAFLGDPDVKAGTGSRFPQVSGLITLSSPHQGSHMSLMDDKLISFLSAIQRHVPRLPNDAGNQVINVLKAKTDAFVDEYGDEIEPNSPFYRALQAQEPVLPGVCCISVGGTSPRLMRVYLWMFTSDSLLPRRGRARKIEFHWRAKPIEARGASPIPDGLPLKLLGIDVDEIMPGRGDGLTADSRCHFPAPFQVEEHLSFKLSHAEELWDPQLQATIIKRLDSFR